MARPSPGTPELSLAFLPPPPPTDVGIAGLQLGARSPSGSSGSREPWNSGGGEVGTGNGHISWLPNPTGDSDTSPPTQGPCHYLSVSWRIAGKTE